jgi:hypothetical protein
MSNTDSTHINDHNVLKLDANVFAPMLDEHLVARNPPLAIEPPLTHEDFVSQEFADIFLDHFDDTTTAVARGFTKGDDIAILNKEQWLRASAQIMAAIQRGLYNSFPLDNIPNFIASLGPDENSATKVFGEAVGALNFFLTDLPSPDSGTWRQCARCLKISSTTVSEDDWAATLQTCNQHADAARASILNATIRDFRKYAAMWTDRTRLKAQDQMILDITNSAPPNFSADPRIIEWIKRLTDQGRAEAEIKATATAAKDAQAIYEQQYDITRHALEEDLHKIRIHHEELLSKARSDAADELTALKAQFRTEKAQVRIELEQQDRVLGKAAKRKNPRPSPIAVKPPQGKSATSRSCSRAGSRAPSPSPSLEYTDVPVVPMQTEETEGNSPTPKADTPLAPPEQPMNTHAQAATDSAAMLQAILAHLDTKLDSKLGAISRRLNALEDSHNPTWPTDFDTYLEDNTSEQNAALANLHAIRAYETTQGYDNNNHLPDYGDPDFVPAPEPPQMTAEECHAAYIEAGGRIDDADHIMNDYDDDQFDEEEQLTADEILKQTQHFGHDLVRKGREAIAKDDAERAARRGYIPGVIKLGPKPTPGQGRALQPITVNSSIPLQTNPADNNRPSYASTAGTDGSVWKTVGKKPGNRRPTTTSSTDPPRPLNKSEATRPYSIEKLRSSTKPNIIAHAQLAFGKRLSNRMKKDQLIVAYQQAQTEAAAKPNNNSDTNPNQQRQRIVNTTEWTIMRKQGTDNIEFQRPFKGDPVLLVRHIQTALRQNTALPEPPLNLVAGRWSSGLTSNFVLTFAGRPSTKLAEAHESTLLEKFPAIFNLISNEGLKKFVVMGVPLVKDTNGHLPTQLQLYNEFARNNPHYRQWRLPIHPTWARSSLLDPTRESLSFTFLLSDPDNTSNRILRAPCYMFGKPCTVKRANSFTQHRQCTRCFLLSHNEDKCPRAATYKRCGICGASGHTRAEHNSSHCRRPHASIPCDCPPSCFNCRFRRLPTAGHYAFSDECPLKKNMRRFDSAPPAPPAPAARASGLAANPAPPPSTL